jgi:hypothetical protein
LQLRRINVCSEESREFLKSGHVEIVQHECRLVHSKFVRHCLSFVLFTLENNTNLLCLLPDKYVIGNMERGLDISDQESILFGGLVLQEHHGEIFGVALVVLLEDAVLCLPHLSLSVLGQIPPVVEARQLLRGDLVLNHDRVSETLELVFGQSLIHGDICCRLHLIESQFSDFSHDLGLLLGGEENLDGAPGEIHNL